VRLLPLLAGAAGVVAAAVAVGRAARGLQTALGASSAKLRVSADTSPYAEAGRFANTEPDSTPVQVSTAAIIGRILTRGSAGRPAGPIPLVPGAALGQAGAMAVTWFGHSSVLIEIDGHRVLADPMWGDRPSPSRTLGPRRMHPTPTSLDRLPDLDAVLISHDHYDHLDLPTIRALSALSSAPFVVPIGIGAHLFKWGIPAARIVELDWGCSTRIGDLTLTCVECRHFSGRNLARNTTQWSSWAIAGPAHRAYFGGDTGYTAAFARTGTALGPFDLTLLPIGAYADLWPDIHMNPEEAVRAHIDLHGGLLVPVHWATFNLGFHAWAEPVRRLTSAAAKEDIQIALPRPGQRIDAAAPDPIADWWSPLG
jgi:L-ascorbate metabolism protein UlaG (beta-lactamase superfamily)